MDNFAFRVIFEIAFIVIASLSVMFGRNMPPKRSYAAFLIGLLLVLLSSWAFWAFTDVFLSGSLMNHGRLMYGFRWSQEPLMYLIFVSLECMGVGVFFWTGGGLLRMSILGFLHPPASGKYKDGKRN